MPEPKIIPMSKRNAGFQVFQSLLTNRKVRHREKRFIVEGVKPMAQLAKNGWEIAALLVQEGRLSARNKAFAAEAKVVEIYELSADLMAELSGKDENSEMLAVAVMPELSAGDLPIKKEGVYVIADRPNSPGNLGSLIRTAEAFGAAAVLTYGHATDFFDPKCIGASIGALFAMPIANLDGGESFERFVELFENEGVKPKVLALDEDGDVDCGALKLEGATIIVVGNETDGLSKIFKDKCDVKVRIPMRGTGSSLNAAASGSILLYQLLAR